MGGGQPGGSLLTNYYGYSRETDLTRPMGRLAGRDGVTVQHRGGQSVSRPAIRDLISAAGAQAGGCETALCGFRRIGLINYE